MNSRIRQLLAIEAEIRGVQISQRPAEQSGGNECCERQRKLSRHQEPRNSKSTAEDGARVNSERVVDLWPRGCPCRSETEQQYGQERDRS